MTTQSKLLLIFLLLFLNSCKENESTSPSTGSIFISSNPGGADILINDKLTGQETPAVVENLDPGNTKITLKLPGFIDTTFTFNIRTDFQSTVTVELIPSPQKPDTVRYSGIKLFEQSAYNEVALVLATGEVVDVKSHDADIFFDGYTGPRDLKSQHLKNEFNTNHTFFLRTVNYNLNDSLDSPAYQTDPSAWLFNNRNDSSYSFLYDRNRNYTKLKIISTGDDGPFRRYVIVEYIYNRTPRDVRF